MLELVHLHVAETDVLQESLRGLTTPHRSQALAALREVHTPAGVVLQGFTVAPLAVARWLGASTLPLRFVPGPLSAGDSTTAPVGFTGWLLDLAAAESDSPTGPAGNTFTKDTRSTTPAFSPPAPLQSSDRTARTSASRRPRPR